MANNLEDDNNLEISRLQNINYTDTLQVNISVNWSHWVNIGRETEKLFFFSPYYYAMFSFINRVEGTKDFWVYLYFNTWFILSADKQCYENDRERQKTFNVEIFKKSLPPTLILQTKFKYTWEILPYMRTLAVLWTHFCVDRTVDLSSFMDTFSMFKKLLDLGSFMGTFPTQ